jgi:hypothetical protein
VQKPRYTLDTRVLSIFFLVAMPFVAFGAFVVVNMARGALREQVGSNLEQRAIQTKVAVERYVGDQFVQLRLVAGYPEVRQALLSADKTLTAADERRLSQAWATGDKELNDSIVGSPVAARLRDVTHVRPGLRLLQVVHANGRLLASSTRGGRVLNADTPWFKSLTQDPILERPWMADIHRPAGSSLALLEIAWPVLNSEGILEGALHAFVDGSDLYGVLAPVRVGRTGHAELVRASDGMVLASDDAQRVLVKQLPGFSMVQAAILERRGYWIMPEIRQKAADGTEERVEPARIVGFSPVDQTPNVQWLVSVEQDLDEALAPVQAITRYLWLHFLGAFGTAILLGLYFSFKLEGPVIEEGMHLHDEHLPKGGKPAES